MRAFARRLPARRALAALLLGCAVAAPALAVRDSGPAPDFTLASHVGSNHRLLEQRGKVVVLNFWNAACALCRDQMAVLNRLYEKHRAAGVVMYAINIDDIESTALNATARLGLSYPVLIDRDKRAARAYQLVNVPSAVIIDRDGRIRHAYRDYTREHAAAYERQIQELLRE